METLQYVGRLLHDVIIYYKTETEYGKEKIHKTEYDVLILDLKW